MSKQLSLFPELDVKKVYKTWIALFSQTGTEIVEVSKHLGRWPDYIVTNERPDHLRTINPELEGKVIFVENKPTEAELELILSQGENQFVTLHGWLRIMPPNLCKKYSIFNGHPGLITVYPELKGKDPQMRAFNAKHEVMGCVLHKVTAGVDEGKVLEEDYFNSWNITEEEMWQVLKMRMEFMWYNFLKKML
tara:strand:+ start:1710 stop:2285 length:576 start_codon:yes stop_codon:yes gene_type:complete